MIVKNTLTVVLALSLGFGLSGCGSDEHHEHGQKIGTAQQPAPTQQQNNQVSQPTDSLSNVQIEKAIQDELNGLTTIETAVNKGDFEAASKTFEPIHDEYHAAVLPPIKAKNQKLAEDMHSKFDALDAALDAKDKNKILSAIKTNRDSLNQAAKELGISVK
ncbi:MAG TPA: hypothetical protein VJ824_16185 [Bacillota bacterium]|nr:hypothetical protein [Bacillota bacterium]